MVLFSVETGGIFSFVFFILMGIIVVVMALSSQSGNHYQKGNQKVLDDFFCYF